jgi:hypothetical protein
MGISVRFRPMLDLNHPQTEHIFAAARLEDTVRDYARRIISAPSSQRPKLLASCEQSIEAMRTLNVERFSESVTIVLLCGNHLQFERTLENSKTFRLPLRHEVGERIGVRWCLGSRGRSFLQSNHCVRHRRTSSSDAHSRNRYSSQPSYCPFCIC